MPLAHICLAILVAAIWGFNFVVIKIGLQDFPPLLFCALRFALAALPLLSFRFPRPVAWRWIIGIGTMLGVVKFGLLFIGMKIGMPAGLSSLVLQSQVFFTILLSVLLLGDRPRPLHYAGMAVAVVGLVLIASELPNSPAGGGDIVTGFMLCITAAAAWGVANILTKKSQAKDMLSLTLWISLVPPLPLLALSILFEGGVGAVQTAVWSMSWQGFGALLYIAGPSTLLAFALWGFLLRSHAPSRVTPFALLVPIFGLLSGSLVLGETLTPLKFAAVALVFTGLAVTVLAGHFAARKARVA